jgi:Spy/CpxP family protein refolding chaperone
MSWNRKWSASLAIASATTWVVGCGSTPPNPTATRQLQATTEGEIADLGATTPATPMPTPGTSQSAHWAKLIETLGLSAEQKTKIEALFANMKASGDRLAKRQEFESLLSGDTVDAKALEAFLRAKISEHDKAMTLKIDAIVGVREILTPAQRQTAVEAILAHLAMRSDDGAQHRGTRKWHRHMMPWAAVASFMLTGDRPTLTTALAHNKNREDHLKKVIAKLVGMDKEDRLEMIAEMKSGHQNREGRAGRDKDDSENDADYQMPEPAEDDGAATPAASPVASPSASPAATPTASPAATPTTAPTATPAATTSTTP